MKIFDLLRRKHKNPSLVPEHRKNIPVDSASTKFSESSDNKDTTPICAKCSNPFAWEESYVTQETPGSAPFHPPGHGNTRPRLFCPHCGFMVVDWHITKNRDFDEWIWAGNNKVLNNKVLLPPNPFSPGIGKGVPYEFRPSFVKSVLDIKKIKEWEKKKIEKEKAGTEKTMNLSDVQILSAKENVKGLIVALREDEKSEVHKSAIEALVGIGTPSVKPLIASFKNAERAENYWIDKDKFLRSGILEILGKIGDPLAVETILLALDDNIPFVRNKASEAYEKIGETVFISELPKVSNKEIIHALQRTVQFDQNPEIYEKAKAMLKIIEENK